MSFTPTPPYASTNSLETWDLGEADTTDATPTTVGATFAIPANSILVVDADVECIQAGGTKSVIYSVRRAFKDSGGTLTDSSQVDRVPAVAIGLSLSTSVAITRTGSTGRIDVTGVAGTGLRWRVKRVIRRLTAAAAPIVTAIYGVQFTGSESYYGSVVSGPVKSARCRFRLDSLPTTGLEIVAGTSNGGGATGWLLCWEDNYSGSVDGQLVVYVGIGASLTRVARKFMMPADVGRVFTVHVVCDGTNVFVYLDGRKINVGTAAAALSDGDIMNIGGRSAGTFSSSVTIIDVAEGTTVLSPSDVAVDAAAATPSFAGQTHRYVADATVAATWLDQVGTTNLTRFGAPTDTSFTPTYGHHVGAVEIWGDSIAAGRQSGGGSGDGWKRAVQQSMSTSDAAITLLGFSPASAATKDFDYYTSATGGESINTRLGTLATDLTNYAPADAATILAYGINDIVALNRTAVQLRADVATAVGMINAARPGRPIFVCSVMSVATGSATTAQHTEISSYQSGFASQIASLQATYPNVVGVDYTSVVTDPNDVAILFDGTHPSPATYTAMAAIIAPLLAGAM